MEHVLEEVEGREGLYECIVCRCAEGELPSECPGDVVEMKMKQRIYAGVLDFERGSWRVRRSMGLVIRMSEDVIIGCPICAVDPWRA